MLIKLKAHKDAEPISLVKDAPVSAVELLEEYREKLPYTAMLARINGKDLELNSMIDCDSEVEFLDIRSHSAYVVYQNTISLIYIKAVRDVLGEVNVEIDNSLNKGFYTLIEGVPDISSRDIELIRQRMRKMINDNIPIIRNEYSREEALKICEKNNLLVKRELISENENIKRAVFYTIEDYSNYFYGPMAPSSGYVDKFELIKYAEGILLRFPYPTKPEEIPEYIDDKNIHEAFSEAKRWQKLLDITYITELNRKIESGDAKDMILMSEALHEKKLAAMADAITRENKRIVLIAGPSSSGKTTTAKRLCIQLRVNGLEPLYLGTDDYFVNREDTPLDENGNKNYENLDAVDIDLFNRNMNDLLEGKTVDLPEFDFIEGKKKYGRRLTSIKSNQPIVIEGIHALNSKLTEFIDDDLKYRIYISPFTQLNIDFHNRIPTTDARKLRRMVRDYKYRDKSAAATIDQWAQVRAGEDKNIFPFNGEADIVFNTALAYELSVLKKYVEPLLKAIDEDAPEYSEATRLLELISLIEPIEDESAIPNNSILREFIGGSIFVEGEE